MSNERAPSMQRQQSGAAQNAHQRNESPALMMAGRIRMEQGAERAAQYLAAMEPFIAPGERSHIASVLGLPLPKPPIVQAGAQPQAMPQTGAGMGGMAGMGGIMNLMQLMSGLQAMKGAGQQQGDAQGPNPMQLAQMLGGLMGGGRQS